MKKIMAMMLLATIIAQSTMVAYARDADWSVGSSFNWSPSAVTTIENNDQEVAANVKFFFTNESAKINNSRYNFTMEHNVGDNKALVSGLKISNLPNVGYDTDDDDKDGYHEEAEAYVGPGGVLEADKEYYFVANWSKAAVIPSGDISTVAQRSLNFIEMQTMHYDLLTQEHYGPLSQNIPVPFSGFIEGESSKTLINNEVITVGALDKLRNNQYIEITKLIEDGHLHDKEAEGTITFNDAITLEELETLIDSNLVELFTYESKFTNKHGDWITAESDILSTSNLVSEVNKSLLDYEEDLQYVGVTSAKVNIILNNDIYETMINNESIYFLDLSTLLLNNINRESSTENVVSDFAYILHNS